MSGSLDDPSDQIDRLKEVRDRLYSGNQSEMARRTGLNASTLSRLFNRDTDSPSEETIVKVLNNVNHRELGSLSERWLRRGEGPMFDRSGNPRDSKDSPRGRRQNSEEKREAVSEAKRGGGPDEIDLNSGRDAIYPPTAIYKGSFQEIEQEPIGYIEGDDARSRPGRVVFWMPVRSDSMEDTLPKGGLVPIQKFNPTQTDLVEDDIYLFRLENAVQIKRLQRRPDKRIQVISDSGAYDDFTIALGDRTDFEILGRVLVR